MAFRATALSELGQYEQASALWQDLQRISAAENELNLFCQTSHLQTLILNGDSVRFAPECEALLARKMPASQKVLLLDALACAPLQKEMPAGKLQAALDLAEICARKALETSPGRVTLKGTLGALLVERGSLDEAVPLLRECYSCSEALNDQGISTFYLGVIAWRNGDLNGARKLLRTASHLYPVPWLMKKAERFPHDSQTEGS
jgi:tetratricopeptide (TPR) repeat protein